VVLLLALGLIVWSLSDRYRRPITDPNAVPRAVTPRGDLAADEQATIALFRTASPAVVYITTLALKRDIFSLKLFEIPQGAVAGLRGTRRDSLDRLRVGDLIVGVEADPVTSVDDLMNALEKYKAGDMVTVAVRREEARLAVPVTLQELP
jgi:hypothetical protein